MSDDAAPLVGSAEKVTIQPAVSPAIATPDHAIRSAAWWQTYVRLPRPSLDWVGVVGAAWSLFLGDMVGLPMSAEIRMIVLAFVGTLFGIRTYEKVKGVA